EGRPVIGKDSRNRSAQNDNQRKQPVPLSSAPSSDMERSPGKEAGFVKDQRNDDQRDEGEGGIPDKEPDDNDIAPTDDTGKKGNSSSSQRRPANAEALWLPDDESEGGDEDRKSQHGNVPVRVRWRAGSRAWTI